MTTILPTLRHAERMLRTLRDAERFARLPFSDPAAPFLRHLTLLDRLAAPTFALPSLWFKRSFENHPAFMCEPGGLWGDLVLARLGDEGALDRLAHRITWRLHGTDNEQRMMRSELRRRAESTGRGRDEVKHTALMTGLALALAERERQQTHRFGRQWVVESAENPRRALFVPSDARPRWYWRWLCDEAVKAARADLLGRPYPRPEMPRDVYDRTVRVVNDVTEKTEYHPVPPATLNREGALEPSAPDMMVSTDSDLLAALAGSSATDPRLLALLARVRSPRERQSLALLAQGYDVAEIAAEIGEARNATDQRLYRIRRKV